LCWLNEAVDSRCALEIARRVLCASPSRELATDLGGYRQICLINVNLKTRKAERGRQRVASDLVLDAGPAELTFEPLELLPIF
jgi:hypothetical protein